MNWRCNLLNKTEKSAFIYKIIMIFSIVLIASSCEDVLDKTPLDRYSDATVWQDPALIEQFVSNTYRIVPTGFQTTYSFPALACLGCFTDEIDGGSEFSDDVNAGNLTPSNLGELDYWERYFNVIGNCNIFLDRIQTSTIEEALKSRMTGEIKVIRAFSYFQLISFFGGVPIVDRPLTLVDDLNIPRSSYDEVMDFVISDLDEAAPLLPLEYGDEDKGRITKGAALAVKSRALLYAASPLNNAGNDQNKWQMAADAAKAVIDLNQYSLYPDYKALFLEEAAYNAEVIWSRPYNNSVDFEGAAVEWFLFPPGSGGRANSGPLHNLVAHYETLNGLLPENDPSYNLQDPFVNRDPRFYASILYDEAPFKGRQIETFLPGGLDSDDLANVPSSGYFIRKFMDESITNPTENNLGNTPWIRFRYAEILLNYAEANYFLGNEAIARDYINMVRSRPGVEMPDVTESGEALFERFVNERRIELAFEEHRWFDVRRWEIAPEVLSIPGKQMKILKDTITSEKTYEVVNYKPSRAFFERNYLLPIPQYEMEKNPLFVQNPGY